MTFNGPGELVKIEKNGPLPNEHSVFNKCTSLAARYGVTTHNLPSQEKLQYTRTRLKLGRFDPQSTITIRMEVNQNIPETIYDDDYVHFQFIIRYVNPKDHTDLVTRVISQKVPVLRNGSSSNDGYTLFKSINENALSVLLAKEAAYRCMIKDRTLEDDKQGNAFISHEDMEDLILQTKRDIDTTVNRISNAYLKIKSDQNNDTENTNYVDPPQLDNTFRKLHHFRRGTILGTHMQADDDRFVLRNLFLRMPLEYSVSVIVPELWMCRLDENNRTIRTKVPAETLALWDDVSGIFFLVFFDLS